MKTLIENRSPIHPGSVYSVARSLLPSCDIGHKDGDLYIRKSAASDAIVERLSTDAFLGTFRDSSGAVWYSFRCCYIPYYDSLRRRV